MRSKRKNRAQSTAIRRRSGRTGAGCDLDDQRTGRNSATAHNVDRDRNERRHDDRVHSTAGHYRDDVDPTAGDDRVDSAGFNNRIPIRLHAATSAAAPAHTAGDNHSSDDDGHRRSDNNRSETDAADWHDGNAGVSAAATTRAKRAV